MFLVEISDVILRNKRAARFGSKFKPIKTIPLFIVLFQIFKFFNKKIVLITSSLKKREKIVRIKSFLFLFFSFFAFSAEITVFF